MDLLGFFGEDLNIYSFLFSTCSMPMYLSLVITGNKRFKCRWHYMNQGAGISSLSNTETTHILIIFNLQSFAQRTRQFSSRLNVRYSYNSGTEYIAIAKMYDGLIRHYKTMKPIKKTNANMCVCCEFIQFGSILGNEHHQAQTGRRCGIRKCVSLNSRNGLKLC